MGQRVSELFTCDPRVRVEPIQSGGGQERGMRSGTVPTPLAVGLGAACEISQRDMASDAAHVERLSQRLKDKIFSELDHVIFNGHPAMTYQGCLNLSFAYVEGESLLMALKDIALSSGSACTSASLEPFLRVARHRRRRRFSTFFHPLRYRQIHYRGRNRLHRRTSH